LFLERRNFVYQALYRKWRPKTFTDVIGQPHITETLQRQVAEGRTSHAYLFTGTRGTGKTTCAKILAKAVNCENPVDGNPCNQCSACTGIENGSFLDVLELDAASNNGVDQVRALRDEAIYSPAHVKKRVYIIDEVHMLSIQAFNALLKILEEPPEHLMFILATTELHKVPPTILSRCQRFSFKRIRPEDIAARLRLVASRERIELTADGAELLARLADGALRDGLSLLDQCSASGETVDGNAVLEVLGLAGNLQTAELMAQIARRDVQAALLLLNQLYQNGKDVGAVLGELSTLVRDLLLRRTAPDGCAALLSGGYDTQTLDRLDAELSTARLLHMAVTLQKASSDLYYSSNRRMDAELCLLRLCDEGLSGDLTALCARMDRLEKRMDVLPATIAAPIHAAAIPEISTPASPEKTTVKNQPAISEPEDLPPWEESPHQKPAAEKTAADRPEVPVASAQSAESDSLEKAGITPAALPDEAVWREISESCKSRIPAMNRAFLDKCHGSLHDGVLTVCAPDDMTKGQLNHERVLNALRECTEKLTGAPAQVRLTVDASPESAPADRLKNLIDFGSRFDNVEIK
jgi:DNA polymerase-3 subunit gamma/tau